MAELDRILRQALDLRASDVHILINMPPMIRHFGDIKKLPDSHDIDKRTAQKMIMEIFTDEQKAEFEVHREVDFCYEIPGISRFRANVYMEERGIGAAFRIVPSDILSADEIGISDAVKGLTRLRNGLVLVTGPAGCGKSTTLAALVHLVNSERGEHIITIEDPIEFVHKNIKSQVNQRQVGIHTKSFAAALRASLREDPDVILVGEMRDLETISMAITAAETGHLVFSTLHTLSAYKTIERVINVFPPNQQKQIRTMLSESMGGVISQQLIRNAEGTGRIAAMEVLIATPSVKTMIRDDKTYQLPGYMQAGRKYGMRLLDDHIIELLQQGKVDPKHAYYMAVNKDLVRSYLSDGKVDKPRARVKT
ncbi:MAG: type IV pilus twitching motility protein PilT [Candidatus Abyssobacteria bacterium SURF_5]|uniref:Type IV pilus twitching motility protein PilT n=1 Tax=Abyssobacteria bacterium (strain SURF_5) TaxID=2093360 RepID=A0A3A4NE13_ABYX5|nr:MAG: type IV pilus twitching motility protein PilT [Candidatus Abyssubacteria bacterium SURF_5]